MNARCCGSRVVGACARFRQPEVAVARVRMIKPEEADADARKVYDGVLQQWGRISNFSQVLAHQPAASRAGCCPTKRSAWTTSNPIRNT